MLKLSHLFNNRTNLLMVLITIILSGCKSETKTDVNSASEVQSVLESRYHKLLEYPLDSLAFPRSYAHEKKQIKKVPSKDWTSGFFAGNLWQIYELTGNENFKNRAKAWTAFIEKEKHNNRTHDMGFKVFCSFGNGLKHENNQAVLGILIKIFGNSL